MNNDEYIVIMAKLSKNCKIIRKIKLKSYDFFELKTLYNYQ